MSEPSDRDVLAAAMARRFVMLADELVADGTERRLAACALLAAAIEVFSEECGDHNVPLWLMDTAGLPAVVSAGAADTGGLH